MRGECRIAKTSVESHSIGTIPLLTLHASRFVLRSGVGAVQSRSTVVRARHRRTADAERRIRTQQGRGRCVLEAAFRVVNRARNVLIVIRGVVGQAIPGGAICRIHVADAARSDR